MKYIRILCLICVLAGMMTVSAQESAVMPQTGRWEGDQPKVSFNVTPEGVITNFEMIVPILNTPCFIEAETGVDIETIAGVTTLKVSAFAGGTIKGTFDDATMLTGTYEIVLCGKTLLFDVQKKPWSAKWVSSEISTAGTSSDVQPTLAAEPTPTLAPIIVYPADLVAINPANAADIVPVGALQGYTDVVFSPDGQTVITKTDGGYQTWDIQTYEPLELIEVTEGNSAAFSPDGALLAVGTRDNLVKLVDRASGQVTMELSGHRNWVNDVRFGTDGNWFVSGSTDGKVLLWDLQSGMSTNLIDFPNDDGIHDVAVSSQGQVAATLGTTIYIWAIGSDEKPYSLAANTLTLSIAFSPDGKLLATGSRDGTVALWDSATGQSLREWKASDVSALNFNADGTLLAVALFDGTVQLSDVTTGQQLVSLEMQTELPIRTVAFSPDSLLLAAAAAGVQLWGVPAEK